MRIAYRITGSRMEAEDVAAEALARAYASWARIVRLDYRDAWVMRVAANVASTWCDAAGRHSRRRAAVG